MCNNNLDSRSYIYLGVGLLLGIGIGIGLGALLGSWTGKKDMFIGLGIPFGFVLGLVIGGGISELVERRLRKKEN